MIIHVEGFDQNNNFINLTINPQNKKIKHLGNFANYTWFKDGIQLSDNYNDWKDTEHYEVIFNNYYINLYIKINNKTIMTPLINRNTTIKDLKNILSIKDNIYFKQIKLKDNYTLEYYDINNLDSLNLYSYSSALECT
jgi:hypothetical protein